MWWKLSSTVRELTYNEKFLPFKIEKEGEMRKIKEMRIAAVKEDKIKEKEKSYSQLRAHASAQGRARRCAVRNQSSMARQI